MHAYWKIRTILIASIQALPTPVKRVALFVFGLWRLAGELLRIVDSITSRF